MFQEFKFRLTVIGLIAAFIGGIFFSPTIDRYVKYYWNLYFGEEQPQPVYSVSTEKVEVPWGWQLHGFVCEAQIANSPCLPTWSMPNGTHAVTWKEGTGSQVTMYTEIGEVTTFLDQSLELYSPEGQAEVKLIVRKLGPDRLVVLYLIPNQTAP